MCCPSSGLTDSGQSHAQGNCSLQIKAKLPSEETRSETTQVHGARRPQRRHGQSILPCQSDPILWKLSLNRLTLDSQLPVQHSFHGSHFREDSIIFLDISVVLLRAPRVAPFRRLWRRFDVVRCLFELLLCCERALRPRCCVRRSEDLWLAVRVVSSHGRRSRSRAPVIVSQVQRKKCRNVTHVQWPTSSQSQNQVERIVKPELQEDRGNRNS